MFVIGIIAGAAGLCLVPMLLKRLFCDKVILAAILATVVASALCFYAHVVLTQISGGVFLVYIGTVFINISTRGHRHERIDGGIDHRFSAENNPFFEGFFSGSMLRASIAMVITYTYLGITGGDFGPLGLIVGLVVPFGAFIGGFFVGIYDIILKPLFQS